MERTPVVTIAAYEFYYNYKYLLGTKDVGVLADYPRLWTDTSDQLLNAIKLDPPKLSVGPVIAMLLFRASLSYTEHSDLHFVLNNLRSIANHPTKREESIDWILSQFPDVLRNMDRMFYGRINPRDDIHWVNYIRQTHPDVVENVETFRHQLTKDINQYRIFITHFVFNSIRSEAIRESRRLSRNFKKSLAALEQQTETM